MHCAAGLLLAFSMLTSMHAMDLDNMKIDDKRARDEDSYEVELSDAELFRGPAFDHLPSNVEALRILLQDNPNFLGLSYQQKRYILIKIEKVAQQLFLDGVEDSRVLNLLTDPLRRITNHVPSYFGREYVQWPTEEKILALMEAFAQRKPKLLKDLLVEEEYREYLFVLNEDNQTLFDLIDELLFNKKRIRTTIEQNRYLPIWRAEATFIKEITKIIVRFLLLCHKKIQLNFGIIVPKEIQYLIISWIVGFPFFQEIQKKRCSWELLLPGETV